jgi:universal stress protein A
MTAKTFESHRLRDTAAHPTLRLKKILVPVDFSPASKNAFRYALRFAEEFGAEVTLLYVVEPGPSTRFAAIPGFPDPPFLAETDFSGPEKQLRALITSTRNENLERPSWKVRTGIPSHEIVDAAKEADVDLIIIATHGYTGWKHFCIGSTAERVVRAAPCPVLVVREKEHEFC